jgi:hypothetical protein
LIVIRCLSALALLTMLVSCQTSRNEDVAVRPDETTLSGVSLRFIVEDIPDSYWLSPANTAPLTFSFFLLNNGDLINSENLARIVVRNEDGGSWAMAPRFVQGSVGGWFRCYDNKLTTDKTLLPLDHYQFDFILKSGRILRKTVDAAALFSPNKTVKYLYSVSYQGKKDDDFLPSLARPQLSADRGSTDSQLRLRFSINDSRVKSFGFDFLDKDRHFLSYRGDFFNDLTNQVSPDLNSGHGFYTDGKSNELVIDVSKLGLRAGKTAADIAYVSLTVRNASVVIPVGSFGELQTKSENAALSAVNP